MPVDASKWSCPDCLATYTSPPGWEVYVWAGARRAAQVIHAQRHGKAALTQRRRRLEDPPIPYGDSQR
jgi:hypothetical protein